LIYATTRQEVEVRRKAFLRKLRLKCRPVADSLEEAGDSEADSIDERELAAFAHDRHIAAEMPVSAHEHGLHSAGHEKHVRKDFLDLSMRQNWRMLRHDLSSTSRLAQDTNNVFWINDPRVFYSI
jgi:hypothetical protein